MAAPQPSPSRLGKITNMGQRYLSRWVSWSGTTTTPPGSPCRGSPVDLPPLSPQPPRPPAPRSRTASKSSSNMGERPPRPPYPLVPKLPVPALGHTLTWYLTHLQPVLDPVLFAETRQLVEEFGKPGGVGEKLQEKLIQRHDQEDNWAYQWWLQDMYLNVPLALPVNSNPGMVIPRQPFASEDNMLDFASKLLSAALEMKERIEDGEIDVDRCSARERHQPMCMLQYDRVFSSYRRPAIPRDKLLSTFGQPRDEQHIIVCYKNHMFKMAVVVGGRRISPAQATDQLKQILKEVDEYEGADPPPVGIMTADGRRTWAKNRQILIGEPVNQKNIITLENCVLVLCFDEVLPAKFNLQTRTSHRASLSKRASSFNAAQQPQDLSLRDEVNAGHQMIHGGGFNHNSANRWFDKTIQFIVSRDGWCGLCYEHSPAEGIVVIQLVEQVVQQVLQSTKNAAGEGEEDGSSSAMGLEEELEAAASLREPPEEVPPPQRLEWKVTPVITRRIQESAENVDRLVEDLDFRILRYTAYGRSYIKKSRCSPDAFLQLSLQLAFFRCHGKLTSTYESASIRRYRQGRVDSIRANTPQVLTWCEAMVLNAPIADRLSKFDAALTIQTEIMVNNILGRGIDLHLLGLREISKENPELETPKIFSHKSYEVSNHFRLSTSQVPTLSDSWMGYGPVVPDGYGASYNPHPDFIVFCLSAFNSCEETSTFDFARNLERALDEMKAMLDARG
ncbi:choline O-acetyltransferase-like isoform X1 [Oratosquilla oratoria]|uniref:choline O-acetyltransferase-like isoform X1 n=1 Tax=Oratosquilla oratoria TaxID=337810 RepID=UPI003F758A41